MISWLLLSIHEEVYVHVCAQIHLVSPHEGVSLMQGVSDSGHPRRAGLKLGQKGCCGKEQWGNDHPKHC